MQKDDPQTQFKLPDEGVLPADITNEVVVSGVYLRLFNQNPGWNVRRPKEFLSDLFESCLNVMVKDQVLLNFFIPYLLRAFYVLFYS